MAALPEHLSRSPVGRSRLAPEIVESHQRDRVLATATEVFAKRGYRATTIDHIVAAARIGVGSFYALFDGKEDCFLQAYDRVLAQGRELLAPAALSAGGSWAERVCAAMAALLAAIVDRPAAARLALVEVQTVGPTALARYEAALASVVPALRAGRESSPYADELPETLESSIVGGIVWFLNQRLVLGEVDAIQVAAPELLALVLDPYLGEAEAARVIAAGTAVPVPD